MERLTATIEEVAKMLGIGRNTAYEAARRNELPVPVIKIGKRLVVPLAPLTRLLGAEGGEAQTSL